MRFCLKIIIFFVAVIVLTSILTPWVKLLFNLAGIIFPTLKYLFHHDFERVFTRILMIFTLTGLFIFYKELEFKSIKEIGVRFIAGWWKLFLKGFLLGGLSLFILVFLLMEFEVYDIVFRYSASKVVTSLIKNALAAIVIGVIEEIFFRGFIFQSLRDRKSLVFSLLATNIFYSFLHFFKGNSIAHPDKFDALSGFKQVVAFFIPIINNWQALIHTFIGLVLVGIALSYAYLRTNSLFFSIGLHAGWVFFIKSDGLFMDNTTVKLPLWLFDTDTMIAGVLSWVLVVFVSVSIYFLTKKGVQKK